MALSLTVAETFISVVLPMEGEPTEMHIGEMEWKYCCEGPEPMDWEDLPEVEAIPPAPKKASPPLEPNTNLSFQEKKNFSTPNKACPPSTEIVLRKIRSHTRLKVSTPTVSPENQ
ncbi:hypothetical protein TNIN_110311 [Trichonephila inaurata madagascariensis]|uniref:Uncharacterized protein n=1 Tax=Trichonephila inaurata madagascariensis TaxID=2747483 RepID=A0A8X6XFU4_9ARAC|nr:hypothetical protein TNIN_110311 [Trichonephila inaurata madagascariensis]